MRTLLLPIFLTTLLSSCYSYKIFPKEHRTFRYTGERKKAVILNPELVKEFEIFQRTGIFEITNDSLDDSAVKIRLRPMQKSFVCGQAGVVFLGSLGHLPVLLPDRYLYSFEEIENAATVQRQFELKIATRYWFWDLFAFRKGFTKKAGQTLLAEYYRN